MQRYGMCQKSGDGWDIKTIFYFGKREDGDYYLVAEVDAEIAALKEYHGGCICQECKREYREDVSLSDGLWNVIRPKEKQEGAGLLCGECIGNRITEQYAALKARIKELEGVAKRAVGVCVCHATMRHDIPCLSCAAGQALKVKE